jgi:valyl-tRNA synthetase
MLKDLPKAYTASTVEDAIYAAWEASGVFNPDKLPDRNQSGEPYCIMMPPPNRTGTLHMGHATMLAIEDILIRFHRMMGKRTLWVPGTDHAPIATQSKVESLLVQEGMAHPREELGREAFLKKVVDFAEGSADTIRRQTRLMGSSCDWSRERYTFDEDRNAAVNEVFRLMWEDGIIERGDRIVNWDPKMQTTVSDDEIEWKEEKAAFYTFKYGPFEIGTSRPETKFGDKYVVMHPDDARYAAYKHGDTFECEWINGPIKATVIKDAAIDPAFGTGVMTITPWHDTVDFDIAERHGLDKQQIIDDRGFLLPVAGDFAGMHIDEARAKIVKKLETKGLLVKTDEAYLHNTAISYRGGGKIEPQIKRQWFVRVNKPFAVRQDTLGKWKKGDKTTLKELMREAVTSGQTSIVPERFTKTYFAWIENLRDWCISRQIWFGHQIPVWYKGEELRYGTESPGEGWTRDPDTLDTWFSSGTWTFSALGWPGKEWQTLKAFHPTAVLETGYDIIFFWVARMVLMSTYVVGEVPFKDVYLHGLVRDDQGRKMSKSLGNVLDPLDLIPKYGTDAVRLSLVMGSTPGLDVKLSETKIESYRNFTNKLWNISRFILQQMEAQASSGAVAQKTLSDRWIESRLAEVVASVTKKLETYQLSAAAEELRDFTWNDLADWYLEIAKVEGGKASILKHILETMLKLWHPFMPFVTEHVWELAGFEGKLIVATWPERVEGEKVDAFERLRVLVTDMRRLRAEQKIEPAKQVEFCVVASKDVQDVVQANMAWIQRLANASTVGVAEALPADWPAATSGSVSVALNVAGAVDLEAEREKAKKELVDLEKYVASTEQKLTNQEFVSKAPAHVVETMKQKLDEAKAKREVLTKKVG